MRVRVIVADQGEARFYDLNGMDARLQPVGKLTDPDAQPQDRAIAEANRRTPGTPHLPGAESRPRKDAAMRFARQVAAELEVAHKRDGFERLVLVAGPAFIGLLRSALPDAVRTTLVAEVRKDLVSEDDTVIHAYLPPETFK